MLGSRLDSSSIIVNSLLEEFIMTRTWIQLMNDLFQAHRDGDVITEHIILQELENVEPDYADLLDTINY
jgi:hypothetical protein